MRLVALIVLLAFGAPAVAAADVGLITGAEHGTSHQFGLDLKRLVKAAGINLTVYPSHGSIDNIAALDDRANVSLGIVQSDVLDFIAGGESSPVLTRIAKRLRVVFPLYSEDVHIVARRDIGDFEQLAGRRVAIGPAGSGSYLTARLLFKLADVRPREFVPLDPAAALAQLKAGAVDAMVYVAPSPLKLLADHVSAKDGLVLLPMASKSVLEAYDTVVLPANLYAWQTRPVTTVAVKAALVSLELEGRRCEEIGRFARQVAAGMGWLRQHGHPRWQRVDLGYQLKGWTQSECVRKYLDTPDAVNASPRQRR